MSREKGPVRDRRTFMQAQRVALWLAARESQTHSSPQIPYRDTSQNIRGVIWVDHGQSRSQASAITESSKPGFVISTGHDGVAELVLPPGMASSLRRK